LWPVELEDSPGGTWGDGEYGPGDTPLGEAEDEVGKSVSKDLADADHCFSFGGSGGLKSKENSGEVESKAFY
jgi:hypothetical protein